MNNLLLLSFVLFSSSILSFSINLETRAGKGGLQFDSTCTPYLSTINAAVDQAKAEAKAALADVSNDQSINYPQFFRPQDKARVRKVFKNAIWAMNKFEQPIPVSCVEDNVCIEQGAWMYVHYSLEGDWRKDRMNMCVHGLDGSHPHYKAITDFCVVPLRGFSLSEYLLHELMHIYVVGNYTRIGDLAYTVQEAKNLAADNAYDEDGNLLDPTYNANNYALYAWNVMQLQVMQNPSMCSGAASGELRKLLNAADCSNSTTTTQVTMNGGGVIASSNSTEGGYAWVKGDVTQDYLPDSEACHGNDTVAHGSARLVINVPANSSDIYVGPD